MRRRQGFTLVEVVVGIGVMTTVALCIFSLMQQMMKTSTQSRRLTNATHLTQIWIERLKLDALRWTAAGDPADTTYLKFVGPTGEVGKFINFPLQKPMRGSETRIISNAFDIYEADLDTTNGSPAGLVYCASYRLNWVYENKRVIRADVRVWWERDGYVDKDGKGANIAIDYPTCQDDHDALNPGGKNFDRYRIAYLSTVLRAAQ